MIVTGSATTVRRFGGHERVDWRCLARRGMLHSECESVDLVRLSSGARVTLTSEVDETVLVVRGSVLLREESAPTRKLGERELLLVPAGERGELVAGEDAELVLVRVWPEEISAALPPRVPEMAQ